MPQRGDRRLYPTCVNDSDHHEGYVNPSYVCISDDVSCGLLEQLPDRACYFCHPDWRQVGPDPPVVELEESRLWYAQQAVRNIQKDLRHYVGRNTSFKIGQTDVPIIRCDDGAWVRLDFILQQDVLWCHQSRRLNCEPLYRYRSRDERKREVCKTDCNCSSTATTLPVFAKERIRLNDPPHPASVADDVQPFDRRMVTMTMRRHELRLSPSTRSMTDDDILLCDGWVIPWAIRTRNPELTGMEIDPSMTISNTLANATQEAFHATECYNLKAIMEQGIKAGRDLMGNHQASGRLRSHWGVFAPMGCKDQIECQQNTPTCCVLCRDHRHR